ncbi:hypothetical protein PPERSA_09835 [Pseudocohnilembus persalinus]|uniref:ubiquitinyl hydrolase 1 n=1 Tax=Pseudocohnilembus persalinus TaxID=266149 RepID=A0A0V0QTT0_PSEPJ|nr:hypothetical protein PPERSA_09835 [Pseudocohnilembus persalinus]|eukprot:KRX05695.1 hypothetical protein PPERSA_09835 [Pseudocohnilembus persalinus]
MQKKNANTFQVYWEQQGIDQLCGVHTLNSLLQGPYFNEIEMAEVAMQLDQQEQHLTGIRNNNKSENVANDGNFSIQVLANCLSQKGLKCESIESQINRNEDLQKETGFICHSQSHWFAIRKVNGEWFNLNSCSVYGPQPISAFHLSAFMQNVRKGGFTIFVVKGKYPAPSKNDYNLLKHQRYLSRDIIDRYQELEKKQYGENAINIGAYENFDQTMEESKKLAELVKNQEMPELEEPKTKQFQGQGISLKDNTSVQYHNFDNLDMDRNEDPELLMVLQSSLRQALADKFKEEPKEGIKLRFVHPNGERTTWTFNENSFIEDLYDYAFYKQPDNENFKFHLSMTHPQRKFINLKQTLVEADLDDMDMLYITAQ